jgi:hypothetical protein
MRQLSLLLWAWIHTTRNFGQSRLWGPFLVYALLQALALFLLTQFHRPILSPVLVPFLRAAGGEAGVHYPVFFLALPVVFSRLMLLFDLMFGAWLFGVAFLLFWQADRPTEPATSGRRVATRAWGRLILARLPVAIGLGLFVLWLPAVIADAESPSGWALRGLRYGTLAAGSLLEALFLYAPLLILVEGMKVSAALKRSVQLFLRVPVATFGAVLIPNLVQIPLSYVLYRSETIVSRLSPEIVGWAVLCTIAVYSLATFYIVGVGTRLFRVQTEGLEL